jgi:hypothetical protein
MLSFTSVPPQAQSIVFSERGHTRWTQDRFSTVENPVSHVEPQESFVGCQVWKPWMLGLFLCKAVDRTLSIVMRVKNQLKPPLQNAIHAGLDP